MHLGDHMALEPDVAEKLAFLGWRPRQPSDSIEPPWYGPVCPVVWEGRSREAPPYPDQCDMGAMFLRNISGHLTDSAPPADTALPS